MPKMNGYVQTFKIKDGDKDENNKLMSFRIDDEKLLEKYKAIWTKIECESFTVISIDSLLVYEKYYLQVHLENCAYKIANKQMTDYLDYNLFED